MRRWKINKFYKFKYKECTILLILLCIHSRKSQGSITFSRFTGNYNLTLEGGQLSSLITRFQKNPISLSKCVSWLNTFQIQSAIREKKWHVFLSLLFMTIPIIIQAAFLGPWSRQVVTEVKIRPFFTAAELFMDYYCGFQIVFLVSRKKAWMMIVSCLRTLLKLERLNHDHKFEIQYKPQRVMLLLHSFWCKWEWKGKSWMYRHANNNNWLLDSNTAFADSPAVLSTTKIIICNPRKGRVHRLLQIASLQSIFANSGKTTLFSDTSRIQRYNHLLHNAPQITYYHQAKA